MRNLLSMMVYIMLNPMSVRWFSHIITNQFPPKKTTHTLQLNLDFIYRTKSVMVSRELK